MKKEKNFSIKSSIIFVLVTILAVLQIIISNRLSNYGEKIANLSKKTDLFVLENERLKKKIASSSSLTTLTEKAKELGFNQKEQVVYLDELYAIVQNSFK